MPHANRTFHARSAAKVNLTLDITGLRPNGYHELQSIVHTVGIWDTIDLTITSEPGDELCCSHSELENQNNLCLKAVRRWREVTGLKFGTRIRLEKNIPFGAGLGGGSGNAAAILVLLQTAFNHPLPADALSELASKLGADVPLFLSGGAMLMEGIGERITPLCALDGWLVIVKPPFGMGTPEVYSAWDAAGEASRRDTPALLTSWPPDLQVLGASIGNDLALAAQRLDYDVERWLRPIREAGALGAIMTGSGSAVFGVFPDESTGNTAVEAIRAQLAKDVQTKEAVVFLAPLTARGVEVAPPHSG